MNRYLTALALAAHLFVAQAQRATPPYKNAALPIDERVEDLLSRMTLDEKIAQIQHLHSGAVLEKQELSMTKLQVVTHDTLAWGFIELLPLTSENARKHFHTIQEYMVTQTRLGIPILSVGEALHGSAHDHSTIFPQNIALGSTFNPELATLKAYHTSQDLHYQGVKQILAPCIDAARDLRWGRVEECHSEDAWLCGLYAINEVSSYLDNGISPMIKHFGAHGKPVGGLNLASVESGRRDLLEYYLKPFEMVVKNTDLKAVMSSYNSWDRVPNSASHYLLNQLLRQEWGFEGYVYSDWAAVDMLQSFHRVAHSDEQAAYMALTAGLDVEVSSSAYQTIPTLIEDGILDEALLNQSVARVLKAKFELGLFENPYNTPQRQRAELHSPESVQLAKRMADESTVLLENKKNILPLQADAISSIAIIGPNANQVQFGDYTWSRSNADGVTPLQAIQKMLPRRTQLHYAPGCDMMSNDESQIAEAVAAAEKSDVVLLFCGTSSASLARDYTRVTCGEGFDLSNLRLTGAQPQLIQALHQTGKPVVLILVSGKPFDLSWEKEHLSAILVQWYAGEQAGNSIADILFGEVNPSGRLSFSFPNSPEQFQPYYDFLPSDKGIYKRPGSYEKPGRDYVFSSPRALYPFGYGLSYSTFRYESISVDKEQCNESDTITLQVEVTNTSNRDGYELVQAYVHDVVASVAVPVKKLRAFSKEFIKAGETKTVTLQLPVAEWYLYDMEMQRKVEAGEYVIQVGSSAENITHTCSINVGRDLFQTRFEQAAEEEWELSTVGAEILLRGEIRDRQATLLSDVSISSLENPGLLASSSQNGTFVVRVKRGDILTFTKVGYAPLKVKVDAKSLNITLDYGE